MAFVAACVTIGPMTDATAADKAVTAGDVIETHEHKGDFKEWLRKNVCDCENEPATLKRTLVTTCGVQPEVSKYLL